MRWLIKSKPPKTFFQKISSYPPLLLHLFYHRGLRDRETIDKFLQPDFLRDLYDPFLMKGMDLAVKRIFQAIKNQEKVVIYGDYDADGICAAAILFLTFKNLGLKTINIYIPDRDTEGHGLNEKAIRLFKEKKTDLLITVDCGIRDNKEVALAKSLGIDVIITDHHQVGSKLPPAQAVVNPWQKNDKYPFKELVGAGVAYKLALALIKKKDDFIKKDLPDGFEKWLLDLVAIATVADVKPLVDENRMFVKYGLGVLAQTQRLGLQELMKKAQLNPQVLKHSVDGEPPLTNLDGYTLAYILGPRINAAGRIDHADIAFKLLITEDKNEAASLAGLIEQRNQERQNLVEKIMKELENRISKKVIDYVIFEGSPDWPAGILGLVASKLVEKYHRPTFIFQEREDLIYTSARSIAQFDLIQAIEDCAEFLEEFGGHREAAGFRLKPKNLSALKEKISHLAKQRLKKEDLEPYLEIEAEIKPEEVNWENYQLICQFEPFGCGNPRPRFLLKGLEVINCQKVGNNGQHFRINCQTRDKKKSFKGIAFSLGDRFQEIKIGQLIDLVFEIVMDDWSGFQELQLKIIDFRPHIE